MTEKASIVAILTAVQMDRRNGTNNEGDANIIPPSWVYAMTVLSRQIVPDLTMGIVHAEIARTIVVEG